MLKTAYLIMVDGECELRFGARVEQDTIDCKSPAFSYEMEGDTGESGGVSGSALGRGADLSARHNLRITLPIPGTVQFPRRRSSDRDWRRERASGDKHDEYRHDWDFWTYEVMRWTL